MDACCFRFCKKGDVNAVLKRSMKTLLLKDPCARRRWPKAGEAIWERLDPGKCEEILAWGSASMEKGYPVLLATQFLRFSRDGNRKAWENPYFARRKALFGAALSECIAHEDAKLDFVIDGLWLICEETSWVLSAHNNKGNPGETGMMLPEKENPYIDLFAAQTGATMAIVLHLLRERLDAVTPQVSRRVEKELMERIIKPYLYRDDFWWMGWTRSTLNNWTPWIVSNVLMTAQYMLDDLPLLTELTEKSCLILDRYLDCMPSDGGCDEGTAYWNMAGGSLLDCLESLRDLTGGQLDVYGVEKIQQIGLFPLRSHVAGPWFWNFADCDARPMLDGERLYTYGKRIGNEALMQLGAFLGSHLVPEDTPQASRVMDALFTDMPVAEDPKHALTVTLPDLEVFARTAGRMYGVIKCGNNHESHNHNDVGSFMIYVDDAPIIIDVGNMVYTRKTFSSERYTIWNTRSMYHNVPMIGENGEQGADAYAGNVLAADERAVTIDLTGAYPSSAGAAHIQRTMAFSDDILLKEEAALNENREVSYVLMSYVQPEPGRDGIRFGPLQLMGTEGLKVSVEEIPVTDARMAKNFPGKIWRTVLTSPVALYHIQQFRFTVN